MPGCSVASKGEQEDWLFQLLCGYGVCGGCQPLAGVCGLLFSRQLLPAERAAAHQHLMSCRGCQGARGKRRQHINLLCTGLTARATDIPCSEHEHHSCRYFGLLLWCPSPEISSHLISSLGPRREAEPPTQLDGCSSTGLRDTGLGWGWC